MIFRYRQSNGANKSKPRLSRLELFVDSLETRTLLTTTFFFDFGAGLPAGGLNTNVDAFRDIAGPNTGTDLALDAGMNAGDDLTISRVNYDFDGNGTPGEMGDVTALAAAALPLIQRALEPFDIDVQIAAATSLADVAASMAANAGDAAGEFDAYNFVTTFTSTTLVSMMNPTGSVGQFAGLLGLASRPDFNGAAGNFVDEATQSYADRLLAGTPGTPGTPFFNQNLAQRMAYTATHEGAHTMGLRHSTGLEASGDIIRLGSNTRNFPFIVTRFDLNKADGPSPVNNYQMFANDLDIGLRDADSSGLPDLAYVTGTGGHDLIDIDPGAANMVDVSISSFSDTGMTTLIGSETYSVDLTTDTDGTILVDASINADLIDLDGTIASVFRIRGGTGLDGATTENDIIRVDGGGAGGTLFLTGAGNGSLVVDGGAVVDFSELEDLDLNNFGALQVLGDTNADDFELRSAGVAGDFLIEVDGFEFSAEAMDFTFVGGTGNDTLTIDNTTAMVNRGVTFHGDDDFDSLFIQGNPGFAIARETYLVGATEDAGTWILDPNDSAGVGAAGILDGDELVIDFTGLDPVDTSTPAVNFDILLTPGADNVRFEFGGDLAGFLAVRVVDVGGTFETFRYANKQNVTMDALGDDDVITSVDAAMAASEVARMLIGNDGNDTFQLGGSDVTAIGNMGNDQYFVVDDTQTSTLTIVEQLGEGSDTVDFGALAMPAMATDPSGTSLATAANVTINVGAAGQQKHIEFGINVAPHVAYTMAPAIGVPFMTMNYEVAYTDVGTMSTHTAQFDWGDGGTDAGVVMGALGMGMATGSHQFNTADMFNVVAMITDDEGLTTNEVTVTTIQQFALLPDQKNPALTALYVGGTVGIDVLKFKQLNSGDIRAILNGDILGEFTFDGAIFGYGGSGNDLLTPIGVLTKTLCFEGGGDVDVLRGSDGDDFLFGQGGKDTIVGRNGNDTIVGGTERDYLFGHAGDDSIEGGEGNDVIKGGDGTDFLDGSNGNDVIRGQAGHDILLGRGNNDTLVGGPGDDVIAGGSGQDRLLGGGGNDLLLSEASTHDSNQAAWESIRDEWVFSAVAIPMRISNIMLGGGLNGANTLMSGVTIFDDGQVDNIVSGAGTDWYLVFPTDDANGVAGVDIVTML